MHKNMGKNIGACKIIDWRFDSTIRSLSQDCLTDFKISWCYTIIWFLWRQRMPTTSINISELVVDIEENNFYSTDEKCVLKHSNLNK